MTENTEDAVAVPVAEPTDDETPDGTQIPTDDDLPDEEGDAGVGDVELEDVDDDQGDAGDPPLSSLPE